MTWDPWTLTVLVLAVLSVLRPVWAVLEQRHGHYSGRRRQRLARAGGGAAMLAMAAYLVTEARQVTGLSYWDPVELAVHAPFMRTLPTVWVPALCWVLLAVLGCGFLFEGIRGSRGPRDPLAAVWAFNEMAIFGALLWWKLYVPDNWAEASFINFALQGIYLSTLIGGFTRFVLVMRGPGRGGAIHPAEEHTHPKGRAWLGRLRRY